MPFDKVTVSLDTHRQWGFCGKFFVPSPGSQNSPGEPNKFSTERPIVYVCKRVLVLQHRIIFCIEEM